MKRLIAAACMAVATCSPAPALAVTNKSEAGDYVDKYECAHAKLNGYNLGSRVSVSGVQITARHVTYKCALDNIGYDVKNLDLHILNPGDYSLPTCRLPYKGEKVVFKGYPARTRSSLLSGLNGRRYEEAVGVVSITDAPHIQVKTGRPFLENIVSHSAYAKAPGVRPGYSGGGVWSLDNGDFLGVIVSSIPDKGFAAFVHAEAICKALEDIKSLEEQAED